MAVKRGSSWQGIVHDRRLPGGRARRSFDKREEAETWELETKLNVREGALVERSGRASKKKGLPYTLKELLDYTVEHHWSTTRGKAKSEINARQVIAILGPNLPIKSVDMMALDKVRTVLRKTGNALATINRKMSALGMMLTKAKDLGAIQAVPRVKRYKEAENRVRRFTPEEEAAAEAFFHRIGHEEMRDFVLFSLDTGLRQSEALGLTSANFVNGKVQVWGTSSKSQKSRTVPLTARAREIAERLSGGPREPLWSGLTVWGIRHYWGRLAAAIGAEDDRQFVPHVLRHEFCSRLADAGINAPVIMELAGHSTLIVTQRYVHIRADTLVEAIKKLEPQKRGRKRR